MPAVTPPILLEESKKLGQQSASQTLKAIARAYPGKLSGTLSLVALENALLLAYPLFAGFAVDSIIRGDAGSAVWYAAVVLGFWVVGAARRALDTRTFTRIYADLAVPVILNQRLQRHSTSRAAARVVLARDFVDFFEKHVPTIATALVSIVGAAAMLLVIEPWVGLACLLALLLCVTFMPGFARRIGLSDREAIAFLSIGLLAALLFVVAITQLALAPQIKAGHIYAVMTYLWTFVSCLDEAPSMIDQLARLKDIGKRVDPGLDR